nr:hypothetical protein [Tanacetum cinerariifolium]
MLEMKLLERLTRKHRVYWKCQWFWGFEVKVVGCSREQWEWRETGGLGFTGVGGKSIAIPEFLDTLIQHLESVKKSIDERAQLKREYDSWVNERQMQTTEENVDTSKALDASSVNTESNKTESKEQDTSSKSGNDAHDVGADIRTIYDEEPLAKVQTTAEINVFAIGQHHTEQPEFNNEGEVDQNAKECHDTCPLPAILTDNQIPEHLYQSLEFKNICLKKTVAQFQKDFSRLEAHCVTLELKYQNHALKEGQHSQFSKEKSNEAKVKHDIDVLKTINIELEHKMAKLLKENETLKKHYKELFDSIKITRVKTIEHTASLIATNDKFKAQLQEKWFAIVALKNELRKSTGNITTHYLPKEREAASAKPHHMIASSNSRISSKNMPRFTLNDIVHNHYLEEAKKKTQERHKNSVPGLMPSARSQSTANGSKPKPRSNTQTYRNWPTSKSSFATTKIVPIAEHPRNSRNDSCVTKFLKEVNSRAKVPSNKTTNRNKLVEQISVAKKQKRQIPKGHSSELEIHDHNNEPCSSKLVPKVVPLRNKTATSRQELELLFHNHITMRRSTLDDGVAASFQQSRIQHHMLLHKLKGHTKHQESLNIKTKTFANSDIPDLPLRYQIYQGRLLASFQDDAKYEHGGQDTRSQGGKRRSRQKDKDLKISDEKTKSKDNDKRLKIKDHKA